VLHSAVIRWAMVSRYVFAYPSTKLTRYVSEGGIYVNGDVVKHNGLVTPPSPRSQSSDSGSGRYRRRRRRGRSARSESVSGSSEESESEDEGPAASTSKGGALTKDAKAQRKTKSKRGAASRVERVEDEGEDDLHSEATSSLAGSVMSRRGKGSGASFLVFSIGVGVDEDDGNFSDQYFTSFVACGWVYADACCVCGGCGFEPARDETVLVWYNGYGFFAVQGSSGSFGGGSDSVTSTCQGRFSILETSECYLVSG
jgi:hypothetical protein